MIIANQTSNTEQFEFEYVVDGPLEAMCGQDTVTVQVDAGPDAAERAREVFLRQLDCWHERDRRWTYSEPDDDVLAEQHRNYNQMIGQSLKRY